MDLIKTRIGRFRIIAFLEGTSLLILVFIAVPLKYYFDNPNLSKQLGPVHGALFILFVFYTLRVGADHNWKFKTIVKVILASFIPFGTFYIDSKILSKVEDIKRKQF